MYNLIIPSYKILKNCKLYQKVKEGIAMFLRLSDGIRITKRLASESELAESLESLLASIVAGTADEHWVELEVKRPLPRRIMKRSDKDMRM